MVPGLLLTALLALPAAAAADYTVILRLEDGLEERKAVFTIEPNGHLNSVFTSTTGARVEKTLFHLMALETTSPRRVDLSYQLEWSRYENGIPVFIRQAMDWSRIPEDREVLLLDVDNRWRLWGTIGAAKKNNCLNSPKGGGLKATIHFSTDGIERTVTRRTSDGATSVLSVAVGDSNFFRLSLTARLLGDNGQAEVDSLISYSNDAEAGQSVTTMVSLKKETSIGEGMRITLERVPLEDGDGSMQLNKRDPDTGWYIHKGSPLSFSYPPEWKMRESCDKSQKTTGWNLTNRHKPENPLHNVHLWGFLLPPKTEPLKEEGTAELLDVDGGRCLVWRDEIDDPLCREKCDASLIARAECRAKKEGGLHAAFNFDLGKESGLETKRFGHFIRFIKSFKF
ncbi:MAG: hypothetical protein COB53_10565 [Elusimicrobia bacterium]|nr:MAG: hypothetical protein COB53_10565 [Elusimicrobiota bacterium]